MADPLYPQTIAQLKTQLFRKFFRNKPDAQAMFDDQIQTWVDELSKAFRFWFLEIEPGSNYDWQTTPVTLSSTVPTRLAGQWVDRGWLVLSPGVRSYDLYAPFENEEVLSGPSWWHLARAGKVYYVKLFDGAGVFQYDLPAVDSNQHLSSQFNMTNGGKPAHYFWETNESKSTLRFFPTPGEYMLAAVKFKLEQPPIYESGGQEYHRFLTFAPRVLEYYCLIELAEFFDEPNIQDRFAARLYGKPTMGLDLAIQQETGLIGDLVRQTRNYHAQQTNQLQRHVSAKAAVGRSQSRPTRATWNNPKGWYL